MHFTLFTPFLRTLAFPWTSSDSLLLSAFEESVSSFCAQVTSCLDIRRQSHTRGYFFVFGVFDSGIAQVSKQHHSRIVMFEEQNMKHFASAWHTAVFLCPHRQSLMIMLKVPFPFIKLLDAPINFVCTGASSKFQEWPRHLMQSTFPACGHPLRPVQTLQWLFKLSCSALFPSPLDRKGRCKKLHVR